MSAYQDKSQGVTFCFTNVHVAWKKAQEKKDSVSELGSLLERLKKHAGALEVLNNKIKQRKK